MPKNTLGVFLKHRESYEQAIRRHVCEECIDFAQDGSCVTHDSQGCAVFRYLPELVQIALGIHERKIDPYAKAVQKRLCSQCENSKGSENCELRENIDCGLNRYLPLVLDAIEEVNRKLGLT